MFKPFIVCIALFTFQIFAQDKKTYLEQNRYDLEQESFQFPQQNFKVLGFGAYHGSAKTETVEFTLLKNLMQDGQLGYYLPETDYSTAHYFNTFLQTGDTVLLKDLVNVYGDRVPQERSIAVYNKWKKLKQFNDALPVGKKIEIVGIDKIACFKYVIKHLLNLMDTELHANKQVKVLRREMKDHFGYSAYYDSESRLMLKEFVSYYEEHQDEFVGHIEDINTFDHIIENIKYTYDKDNEREKTIYENYIKLSEKYKFNENPQFVRFGFFHLEKSREGENGYPSFFTRLIEGKVYKKDEILTVIGYLTKSKVLWDYKYTKEGEYKGYVTRKGYGIGDYWLEYFRGIKALKKTKLSDMTLFRLNQNNSPYLAKEPDLMEVKMLLSKSNKERLQGLSTLDFIDYAILISNSKANIPIQEL